MRRWLPCVLLVLLTATPCLAALTFPTLTGRVVDTASILSPEAIQQLNTMLAAEEAKTTNQIVVVTLPSLQGTSIEDFGTRLGRAWKVGQKGKDNGALLIVAPKDHKVRIEVGYGLEGTLTDLDANQIVQNTILPMFRTGSIEKGVLAGTAAIIAHLDGGLTPDATPQTAADTQAENVDQTINLVFGIIVVLLIFSMFLRSFGRPSIGNAILPYMIGSSFGGSGGGFGGGGGFSGGGGSFGGGGASGGW
jgi:uncharacterized protein